MSDYMCNQRGCLAQVVIADGHFVHLDKGITDHSAYPLLVSSYEQAMALGRLNAAALELLEACQLNEDVRVLRRCSYNEAMAIGERYGFRDVSTLEITSQLRSMAETKTRIALAKAGQQ